MMKIFEKKLLALSFIIFTVLILPCGMHAQVAFSAYSPTAASSIKVCEGEEKLTIDFTMSMQTSNPVEVRVKLADGVEYVGGLTLENAEPAGAVEVVASDISNPNEPVFKLTSTDGDDLIALATKISFSFKRRATCKAWENAIGAPTTGFLFKDKVTVTAEGSSTNKESNTYSVSFPNLIISAPAPQNNKQPGDVITRQLTISSGSANTVGTVYLSVDHAAEEYFSGVGAYKLEIVPASGSPIELSNPLVEGSKRIYMLTGNHLGADALLTNGEIITLRETFILKTCNPTTTYALGWGCSIDSQCEVKTAQTVVTMQAGAAKIAYIPLTNPVITSPCEPFSIVAGYRNEGSGGKMGGMYDVRIFGQTNQYVPDYFVVHQFVGFKVGTQPVANFSDNPGRVDVRLENFFTSDPDGLGVGLDDLDGDGFYDDLPVGATLNLEMIIKLHCDIYSESDCNMFIRDYGYIDKVIYRTACDKTNWVEPAQYHINSVAHMSFRYEEFTDLSYMPLNVEAGRPFDMRIEAKWRSFRNSYITNNTRYIVEIDLIPGLDINPANIMWASMIRPIGENNFTYSAPQSPSSVTQVGNKLVIVSPDNKFGRVFIKNVVYNCQSGSNDLRIKYRIKMVLDYVNNPDCLCPKFSLICGEYIPRLLGCDPPCSAGPMTGIPVVEREDNSLGWTDEMMTTIQSRSNISAYDLSKALYMDEIRIKAHATQYGSASNLGAYLALNSDLDRKSGLTPLSADISITRNGLVLVSVTGLTKFFSRLSSDKSEQIIDWDFTSVLPAGGLLHGDKISIVTRYRVTSERYSREDKQTGKRWNIYNSTSAPGSDVWSGTSTTCLDVIPEMYLMGTVSTNGVNPLRARDCTAIDLGGITGNYARRFGAGAFNYQSEYRPGIKLRIFYVKLPKSYVLNRVQFRKEYIPPVSWAVLTAESVTDQGSHLLYKYSIPDTEKSHFDITVTNRYGAEMILNVSPTCASSEMASNYDVVETYMEYIDYYYYTAKLSTIPSEFKKGGIGQTSSTLLGQKSQLQYTNKPSLQLIDQTGEVELSGKIGSWTIRYNNASQAPTPYIWMALSNVPGLNITKVSQISNNQEIVGVDYSGGKIYHLNSTGVPAGQAIDYKLEFEYSGCAPITLRVMGGWNCNEYPTSPNDYICNINTVGLKLKPLTSAMELIQMSVPPATPEPILCTTLSYEYRIQATDKANIYEPKFTIVPEDGLTVTPNIVQVRYPGGIGAWHNLNVVNSSVNLLEHPALATIGYLKGATEAANNSERQIDVKFGIKTGCEFVSGKNFRVRADGKNTCNLSAKGSGIAVSTPPIRIDGAVLPYTTSASTQLVAASVSESDCKAPLLVKVQQTIIGGTTTDDAYLEIIIPAGYRYVKGSYAPDNDHPGGVNAYEAGTESVSTTANSEDKITVKIRGGLTSGTSFAYKLEMQEDNQNVPPCGSHTIEITNVEKIPGLWCEGVQCSASYVVTGSNKQEFQLDKPYLAITVVSAVSAHSGGKENLTIKYTVSNTSSTQPLKPGAIVTLFSDKDNNQIFTTGDVAVATQELEAEITNTTPLTQTLKVKGVASDLTGNLALTILPKDGCYCEIQSPMVPLVHLPRNYWIGGTAGKPNEWKEPNNWTNDHVPDAAEDVEFATEVNNPTDPNNPKSGPAKENLHLDDLVQNGTAGRVIGNLINDSDKDLVITTGNQLTINGVVEDNNAVAGTIVVKSSKDTPTGTLLFANPGANQDVGATVEFYNQGYDCADCGMYRRSWQYFGIPVNESLFPYEDVAGEETVNQWVEPFNGDKWRPAPYAPDTQFQKFKGYQITNDVRVQPTGVYSFKGTICVCDAFLNLTRTPNVNYSGSNLVGNSYTAAIDIRQGIVFPPEVEETVYLFNTGTRDQWRKLNGSTVSGYQAGQYLSVPKNTAGQSNLPDRIPSMHSFLLKMQSGASCTLQILYDKLMKNTTVNNGNGAQIVWRSNDTGSSGMPSLVMDVLGNESADRLWIFTEPGLSFGFDNGWDGRKLPEKGLSQLYALSDIGNDKFQVAAVPELDNLQIGFDADKDGQYTLEFALSDHFSKGAVYLHDLQTESKHRITNTTSYSFEAKRGDSGARFRLSFDEAGVDSEEVSVVVGTVGKRIVVSNNSAHDYTVHVYTADGKLLFRQEVKSGGKSMTEPLIDGAYVVSLQSPTTATDVRKLIVN